MTLNLFKDFFKSLDTKDVYLMNKNEYPTAEKEYDSLSFVVNKGYSQREQTLPLSQEMNVLYHLDSKQKYDFYYYMVPKKNKQQWNPWVKKLKVDNIDIIKEYYKCSTKKAIEYSEILTDDDMKIIESRLYKGGRE